MIHLYLISGLGADKVVFERLRLRDDIVLHHLPWTKALDDESISSYAARMARSIKNPEKAVLAGLSFGGIMAIEISKLVPLRQLILISSVKTRDEMPPWLRFIGSTALHKLVPAKKLLEQRELCSLFFGCNDPEQRNMLDGLLDRADPEIVEWSINRLLHWENDRIPIPLTHIHGTADAVFPKAFVQPDHWIENGSHFMVYSHAPAVSALLNEIILH